MKSDLKVFTLRVLGTGFSSLIQAASLILLARNVGPTIYGEFSTLLNIGVLCGAVLGFGFASKALVSKSMSARQSTIATMIVIRFTVVLIVWVPVVGFSFVSGYPVIGAAVAIYVGAELLSDLLQGILAGESRQVLATGLLLIQRATLLVAIILSGSLGNDSYWIAVGAASSLTALWQVAFFSTRLVKLRNPFKVIREGAGFWYSNLSASLNQLDVPIMRTSGDVATVGVYSAGARISAPLGLVTTAILNVFTPRLAGAKDDAERMRLFSRLRNIAWMYGAFLVLISPGIAAVLVWFLGPAYQDGRWLYGAVVVGAAISGVSQVYQALFYVSGQAAASGSIVLSGTIVFLLTVGAFAVSGAMLALVLAPILGQVVILCGFIVTRRRIIPAVAADQTR